MKTININIKFEVNDNFVPTTDNLIDTIKMFNSDYDEILGFEE